MRTLTEQLTQYAAYHRDRRNIATHFVGVPMIYVAATTLLCRLVFAQAGGFPLSAGVVVGALASLFYLSLDLRLGALMTGLTVLSVWAGSWFAAQSMLVWLIAGVGGFSVGWVIQFIGHYYEGRKPAFVDDLVGLLIGPLFVVSEWVFMLGLRKPLLAAIEAKVGPTHIRDLSVPVAAR